MHPRELFHIVKNNMHTTLTPCCSHDVTLIIAECGHDVAAEVDCRTEAHPAVSGELG